MPARLTKAQFVDKAIAVHGKRYDYTQSIYKNSATRVVIECEIHGKFNQTTGSHLQGAGCPKCSALARGKKCGGRNRLNTATFIKRAAQTHDGFYDYSEVKYTNSKASVKITCPLHGKFWQAAGRHMAGGGCMQCGKEKTAEQLRLSETEVDERLIQVHGGKIVRIGEYQNNHSKCLFRCTECGVARSSFPMSVLKGVGIGCRCTNFRRDDSSFLEDAFSIHGDKYDYSQSKFTGVHQPLKIICNKCKNSFYQTPAVHIHCQCGCRMCGFQDSAVARSMSVSEFINRARKVHGDRFGYRLETYVNATTKMAIICSVHGEFWQIPANHLKGHLCNGCGSATTAAKQTLAQSEVESRLNSVHGGRLQIVGKYKKLNATILIKCNSCGISRNARMADLLNGDGIACRCSKTFRRTSASFIEDAVEVHGNDRYDYSRSEFLTVKTPIIIGCKQCNAWFEQKPTVHLMGCGCPHCKQPKGEQEISDWLFNHGFSFTIQQKFPTCMHKRLLAFDFYLDSEKTLIEFDGAQHFRPITWFGGETAFRRTQKRDGIKNEWAVKNDFKLIRIRFDEDVSEILREELLEASAD